MAASLGGGGSSNELDINLTPLLDVVLQLIMFFMITVNFVRVDQFDDRVALPVAQSAVPLDATAEEWIFLNLNSEGKLVGNLDTLTLDTPEKLKAHLMREKESLENVARAKGKAGDIKIVVVLRADKNCRYSEVWQVVDSCQRAGFRRWQLRVMTKPA
ncbi:MAG: biopolymer transporter ExbD [Gemmataceae bacterium]|nr:biopolymer transporter ExbD [Gemmataceae bacterium]